MPANAGSKHVTISEQTRAWKGTWRDASQLTKISRQENVGYLQSL
jgi:hypothetical protein